MASVKSPEEYLKLLDNYDLEDMGGYNVARFAVPNIKENVDKFKDIQIRDDDVITIGYPRSGNHWAYEVMGMILSQSLDFQSKHFVWTLIENRFAEGIEVFDKDPSPRQLVSHLRIETMLPKQALEKKTKIVYLLRNPKDMIISWYKFVTSFGKEIEQLNFKGTFDDFLQIDKTGKFHYGNWFDHVLSAEKFINDHPDIPVYVHVFEEMKANPEESTRKLCRFLGYPEDIAVDISKKTKIEVMGQINKFEEIDKQYFSEEKHVLNKGQTGGWRNVLTDEQNRLIDEMFEEKMAGSKLGDLVRPYLKK